MKRNDYKFQLAKSTLTLIPLLGIHYLLFLALFKGTNNTDGESESNNKFLFLTELMLTSIQVFRCYINVKNNFKMSILNREH